MKIIEPSPPSGSDLFTSIWKAQTWLNVLYLFFSFPLGLFYFIILVTGISLGFGLLITVFGIFILFAVLIFSRAMARFEIELSNTMLRTQIRPQGVDPEMIGFWKRFREKLRSPGTWKGLFYLFLRFPMGVFSFCLTVALLASSLGLISTPFLYHYQWFEIDWPNSSWFYIDSLPEAIIVALVGLVLLFISLFVLNYLAWIYGKIARAFLE